MSSSELPESRQTRQKSLPAIVISKLPEFKPANSTIEDSSPEAESDSENPSIPPDGGSSTGNATDCVRFRTPKSASARSSDILSHQETNHEDQFNDLSPEPDVMYKKTPAFMQLAGHGRRRMSEFGTGATGLLLPTQRPAPFAISPLNHSLRHAPGGAAGGSSSKTAEPEKPPHFSRVDLDRYDGVPEWSPFEKSSNSSFARRASCSPCTGRLSWGGGDIDDETAEYLRKRRANNRLLSVEASLGAFRPFATAPTTPEIEPNVNDANVPKLGARSSGILPGGSNVATGSVQPEATNPK